MSRGSLRGADELFWATAPAVPHDPGSGQGGLAGFEALAPRQSNKNAGLTTPAGPVERPEDAGRQVDRSTNKRAALRKIRAPAAEATSGRECHDEKVTAYLAEHGEKDALARRLAGA